MKPTNITNESNCNDVVFVQTWKQEQRIDLWVYVRINDVEHDILVEDKYYSSLQNDQLTRYREYFDKWIHNNRPHSILHYYVLSCMDSSDVKTNQYIVPGFKLLCWDDMISAMKCDTEGDSGSDIFDEFWIKW